jgi:hypothetical protein
MARLASQAKLGFYATPPGVVESIKKALALPEPGTYRFLDTCCGEGEALAQLTDGLQRDGVTLETYGVELDQQRYETAAAKLDKVLWGDALTEIRVSSKAFSFLWLNPPYDWDDGQRLEARFLEAHLPYLAPKGLLVLIVPHRALYHLVSILGRLELGGLYAFPQPEYEAFKQVVVIGRNQRSSEDHWDRLAKIAWMDPSEAWQALPKTDELAPGSLVLPPVAARPPLFASERLNMARAAALVKKSPLWQDLESLTAAKALNSLRPLAPLRHGHLAMLLAGGMMDGVVEANGRRLIIKGSVRKTVDAAVETTDDHQIERQTERYQITIRAIDPARQEIFTIS